MGSAGSLPANWACIRPITSICLGETLAGDLPGWSHGSGVQATDRSSGAAIAALVLLALATRLPRRNRGSQDEPGCVPGIT
jgi:hypothetical protein